MSGSAEPLRGARLPLAWALLSTLLPMAGAGLHAASGGQPGGGNPNAQHAFLGAPEANSYLSRRLRANNWDFELFQPDNLERECNEELCSYEEAREIFEDDAKTNAFWKTYMNPASAGNSGLNIPGLLAGVIAAVVLLIFIGLVFAYCCKYRRKPRGGTRSNDDMEMSGEPRAPPPPDREDPATMMAGPDQLLGLPSYEQAMEVSGQYDGPPPPYTGAPRTPEAPGTRRETSDLMPSDTRRNSQRGSRRGTARRDV
ncbi:transmembrane gamma-carboxyglutamic acid protein 2-like isoform X1 [Lethenteron reissneri]|uniref:transmembrane gamma-carboxyglutamic acid protein 2-like isoform X1 n=1 Tax=Lethenteron reissneri TaxID=7753 RepID=UPI002AB7CC33|nr:transmembrane gamma-carboxyglutamic acid protein 2-like isoform X1 [Lethenteron reissneri]XP_061420274.1 transmembrane gamma-carboxyglutamic acid protein 2-like isoform X1 [Lethenteron reissneri]